VPRPNASHSVSRKEVGVLCLVKLRLFKLALMRNWSEVLVLSTYISYQIIAKDMTKALTRVSQEPTVDRDTQYYLANIGNVKTVDDFVNNPRLFNYAMKAYGLEDMDYAKAFMKKVLNEGITDSNSFANKLTDKRYADFAKAFNFAALGDQATAQPSAQQDAVNLYDQQSLEEEQGKTNEGVRLALYFQRKAPEITDWYQVLADPALSQVVRTAFGMPDTFAAMDIDKQVQLFEKKFDITDFQDPAKLSTFMTRFTTMYDVKNPPTTATSLVSILFSQPTTMGVSTDLLMAMQQMKF
jgi:hypothetical protein